MRRTIILASLFCASGAALAVVACSSSSSPSSSDDGGSSSSSGGSSSGSSSGTTSSSSSSSSSGSSSGTSSSSSSSSSGSSSGTNDGGVDGGGCITLTVKDAPTGTPWCNVSINGGTFSQSGTLTTCVASGTTVTVSATAQGGFVLPTDPWHDTNGDTGSGDPGTISDGGTAGAESTASVTVSATKDCVWVCCPGVGNSPACPTTDQCL